MAAGLTIRVMSWGGYRVSIGPFSVVRVDARARIAWLPSAGRHGVPLYGSTEAWRLSVGLNRTGAERGVLPETDLTRPIMVVTVVVRAQRRIALGGPCLAGQPVGAVKALTAVVTGTSWAGYICIGVLHVARCTSRRACVHWRACRLHWSVRCLAAERCVRRVVAGSCAQTIVYSGLCLDASMQVLRRIVS